MISLFPSLGLLVCLLAALAPLAAEPLDFSQAVVVAPNSLAPREERAVELLLDEAERRTGARG